MLRVFVLALGIAMLLFPVQLAAQTESGKIWHDAGSAVYPGGNSMYPSIVIDSNNTPYAAMSDIGNGSKATVKRFDGTNWVNVGDGNASSGIAQHTTMAISSNDNLYVAYADYLNGQKATVSKFDGSGWVTVGNPGFSNGSISSVAIAIDSHETPYVAYADTSGNNQMTVKKFDGNNWATVGNANFTAGLASFPSLVFDSNDTPYVAFKDSESGNKVFVKTLTPDGTSWIDLGAGAASDGTADYPVLRIDSQDNLYVAYTDTVITAAATVKKWNGHDWEIVGSRGFTENIALFNSLSFDSADTPYLVYSDKAHGNKASVMRFNGSGWEYVGDPGFSADTAMSLGIAIDGQDTPYVVIVTPSYKPYVMKYAAVPKYTAGASAASTTPATGEDTEITLTVKDSLGDTDLSFNGASTVTVTISVYGQAPDGSYGFFGGTKLEEGPNDVTLTFTNGEAKANLRLHKAGTQSISFLVDGVATPETNALTFSPVAGPATALSLATDIAEPAANGGLFARQPVVTLVDAFGNVSTGDNNTVVTASKHDSGKWTLKGTLTATAHEGVVTFTDLGAANTSRVTGAQLAFHAPGLDPITSKAVTLPASRSSAPPSPEPAPTTPDEPPTEPEPSSEEPTPETTTEASGNVFVTSRVNETGLLQTMASRVEKANQANAAPAFADASGHWAEQTIGMIAKLQLVTGYTDGTFRPDQPITREEMVVMLLKIVNLEHVAKDPAQGRFLDLDDTYAAGEIVAAAQAGIVSGKGNGKFDPKSLSTRAEALQMILNTLKLDPQMKALLESLE
jgi:hypothetical protein